MRILAALAATLVLALPARADDFPKECSTPYSIMLIKGIASYCNKVHVTLEGEKLERSLMLRPYSDECFKAAQSFFASELADMGARPTEGGGGGLENTGVWCTHAVTVIKTGFPDVKALELR